MLADIALCWAKHYLNLLSLSAAHLGEDSDDVEDFNASLSKPELMCRFELPVQLAAIGNLDLPAELSPPRFLLATSHAEVQSWAVVLIF